MVVKYYKGYPSKKSIYEMVEEYDLQGVGMGYYSAGHPTIIFSRTVENMQRFAEVCRSLGIGIQSTREPDSEKLLNGAVTFAKKSV